MNNPSFLRAFYSSTISGKDIEDIQAEMDISVIDIDAIKRVIEADDVVKAYNTYVLEAFARVSKSSEVYKHYAVDFIKSNLANGYVAKVFPSFGNDKEAIINYMVDKLKRYITHIENIKKSLKANPEAYGIKSKKALDTLLADMEKYKFAKFIDKRLGYLLANKDLWLFGYMADFRKFGGGIFYTTDSDVCKGIIADQIYNWCMKYDVVVLTHGCKYTLKKELNQYEQSLVVKMRNYMMNTNSPIAINSFIDSLSDEEREILYKYDSSNKLRKLIHEYDLTVNEYIGTKNTLYNKVNDALKQLKSRIRDGWGFSYPVETLYGTFTDINNFIRVHAEHGHKTFKILPCNPGHFELDPDLKNRDDITVEYGVWKVFAPIPPGIEL